MFRTFCMIMGITLAASASAQVPPGLLDHSRPIQGDAIRICVDDASVIRDFDIAVAEAIATSLFLEPTFQRAPGGFPINAEGYLEQLEIAMANTCDLLMGVSLLPTSPFPEWATVTRAYASVPFVLGVIDPGYERLGDIPFDKVLGTAIGSTGEWAMITYQLTQPENRRWRRLPYADHELMLRRLTDRSIEGMILWHPSLVQLQDISPDAEAVRLIAFDPMAEPIVRIAGLVSSRDTFLRNQIDLAIDALVQDGTIADLLEEFRFLGAAGG